MSKALLVFGTSLFLGWTVAGCSSDHHATKPDAATDASVDSGSSVTPEDAGKPPPMPDTGTKPKPDTGVVATGCGSCPADSACDTSGASPKCVCSKDGYKLNGKTGSAAACVDVDECADSKLNDCGAHATCTNTDGSYECACDAPAYKGDGKSCACAVGYSETSGECRANDAKGCSGDDDCAHSHCIGGVCCAEACDAPGACRTSEGATCKGGLQCKYLPVADDTACDDGNVCTGSDKCASGACVGDGTAVSAGTKCKDDDMCGTGYQCDGQATNSCMPTTSTDCTGMNGPCTTGTCDPASGCFAMAFDNGAFCVDDLCTQDKACQGGACMGGTAKTCDDGNPCTDDACVSASGCQATPNDSNTCSDGDLCTDTDHCSAGACLGSAISCDDHNDCTDDSCNHSATSGDPCNHAADDSNSCNDNNACTNDEACHSGACTSAVAFGACNPNADGCNNSTNPVTCHCTGTFVPSNGKCVPPMAVDECVTANPCVPTNATCLDTSTDPGGVQCTCKQGFTGDGFTGNGHTGCTAVCDLSGTFAIKVHQKLSWDEVISSGIPAIAAGDNVPMDSWGLRKQTYSNGKLTVVSVPCGSTDIDLCGIPFLTFNNNAYTQYLPAVIWGNGQVQSITSSSNMATVVPASGGGFSLPSTLAGAAYQEPNSAALIGIHLADPLGAWPPDIASVGTNAAPGTNGSYWSNDDSSYDPTAVSRGVTALAPAGRTLTTATNGPPFDIPATSVRCNKAYGYWPNPLDPLGAAIEQFYEASRVISNLGGTIANDCSITGNVRGPLGASNGLNGTLQTDTRVTGCLYHNATASCDATAAAVDDTTGVCANSTPASPVYCRVGGTSCGSGVVCNRAQRVTEATFIIKKVDATATCATVRGMTF